MSEDELLQWDLVPPDLGSSDLFFTEESYKNISIETDLSEQILSKFKELGPYSYTTDKDLTELKFDKKLDMVASCQISQHSGSETHISDLESNQDIDMNNVKDSLAENGSASPESMEVVNIFDGKKASQCVREPPSSCENSLKSVSPPPLEERSQNMLYGRKRMPYPRYSLLSNPDQVFYLTKFIEYKKKQPERGCRQYARFLQLHKKVQKEQKEFSEYLQKVSLEFKEDYAFLQEVAAEYMQRKHEAKLKRLQEYSPFWLPIDKVPISTKQRAAHELQPVKILLQMGEIPVSFQFPKAKKQTVLDYEILQKKFPTDKAQSDENESPFYDHQVCSDDINAQQLAQKYQCHIVVSSSVLKCLVDNHAPHFENSWDVPVNIHEYQLEDLEKDDHKVVFLDKPFYRQQTTRDVNTAFHKISLAARNLHPNHVSKHTFYLGAMLHKRLVSEERSTNDALSEEFNIMDDSFLETFGTSTSHTSFGTVTKKPVAEKGNLDESLQLESKNICDKKDAKDDLPEEYDVCSDLKPAVSTSERDDSLSQGRRLSDENGSEEQPKMGLISANRFNCGTENSDQIEINSVDKELIEVNQNKSKNNNQQKRSSTNGKNSSNLGNLDQKKYSPSRETNSFKNTQIVETVSDEQGERTNIQENEKRPGAVKIKIKDVDDERIDVSTKIKTDFRISKDKSCEEECDSDSSAAELIIDFESSNMDDTKEEEKPPGGIEMEKNSGGGGGGGIGDDDDDTIADGKEEEKPLKRIAIKINDDEEITGMNVGGKAEEKTLEGIKIKINDADVDGERIADVGSENKEIRKEFHILKVKSSEDEVDSDSSAEELVIDLESSNTDDDPENKLIPDKTKKPIQDIPRSPIVDTPGSPISDVPASPIRDAPASTIQDAPRSLVPDTLASPILNVLASPIRDTPIVSEDRSTNDALSEEFNIMDVSFLETLGTSTSHTSFGTVTKKPVAEKSFGTVTKKPVAVKSFGTVTKKPVAEKSFGTVTKKPVAEKSFGTVTKKPVAEKGNLDESPQLESKNICDKKDAKDDLPEEYDKCSDLKPAVSTSKREDTPPQGRRLSDENGSEEQPKMGLISANRFICGTENSDQIEINSVDKELTEVNQNKSKNNNQQKGNSTNGKNSSNLGNLDQKKYSPSRETNSFKNTQIVETVSDEQGERTNIQENEKRPGVVKIKINDVDDERINVSTKIKTDFRISKDKSCEEECDSDSSAAELIIDFESSNMDDTEEEEKPPGGIEMEKRSDGGDDDDDTIADGKEEEKPLKRMSIKMNDDEEITDMNVGGKADEKTLEGIKIKINDADVDGERIADVGSENKEIRKAFHVLKVKSSEDEVDSDSSAEELVIDLESSNTDDDPENKLIPDKTKKPIQDTPRSPIVDALGSPVTDTLASSISDVPASPIPDTPASLIQDAPGSLVPDTLASPILDLSASPMRDTPESPMRDTPVSPMRDTPASPMRDTPASPMRDTPASPMRDTPESPMRDTPASPMPDTPESPSLSAKENSSQMFDRPLVIIPTESDENVYTFHEIQPQNPNISESTNARLTKKRKHQTAFVLGPLDSILEKQEELLKTTSRMKSENTETTMTGIPEMDILKQLDDNFYETKSPDNPEDYLQPDQGKNVTYCIWNFGDLRLLVRCKYSSIRKTKKRKDFVYMMPKLEYQVGFGYEQTTLSEASKMWISSLIRHNCFIDRIRINAFTSDIMMEELLSFKQISQLYNPISANAFMYNLFRRLYNLKAGSYFVSHNAGEKMSVISQAMPENHHSQAFDLKKMYPESIPIGIPSVIPWVPIDTNLLTPYHTFYERVPCTFHPPEKKKFVKGKKKKNKK